VTDASAAAMTPEAREARAMRGRAVVYEMWQESGMLQDVVAPLVNMGPKDFSRAIAPNPHPDAEQRRRFPLEQAANYTIAVNNLRLLRWLLSETGFDPDKLESIRKERPTDRQLLESLAARQQQIQQESAEISRQLSLLLDPPPATAPKGHTR